MGSQRKKWILLLLCLRIFLSINTTYSTSCVSCCCSRQVKVRTHSLPLKLYKKCRLKIEIQTVHHVGYIVCTICMPFVFIAPSADLPTHCCWNFLPYVGVMFQWQSLLLQRCLRWSGPLISPQNNSSGGLARYVASSSKSPKPFSWRLMGSISKVAFFLEEQRRRSDEWLSVKSFVCNTCVIPQKTGLFWLIAWSTSWHSWVHA